MQLLGGAGDPCLRGWRPCALGACGQFDGGWEGRGRGCGAGLACGVSVLVYARSGLHVWCHVGLDVRRWNVLCTAAAARILLMLLRTWCISCSVVRRGYFRGGLRSTRQRILWTAW